MHQQNDPEVIIMGDAMGQTPLHTNIHGRLPSSHTEDGSAARNQESWLICVQELDWGRRSIPAEARNTHFAHRVL